MKFNRNIVGTICIVGIAFAAGRMSMTLEDKAIAASPQDEMSAEMEAWMKAGSPGKHHKYLDQLAGEWDVTWEFKMKPDAPLMTSTGTMKRDWIFGGRFLKETVKAEMGGQPFEGTGFIGFNNLDGQFQFAWLNSVSTEIVLENGTYNPETKIMSFRGTHRDPATGRSIPTRGTLNLTNPDRQVFTGYAVDENGKEFKSGEGIATRK